jgi:DNA-binding MarR family transcriptional regulator
LRGVPTNGDGASAAVSRRAEIIVASSDLGGPAPEAWGAQGSDVVGTHERSSSTLRVGVLCTRLGRSAVKPDRVERALSDWRRERPDLDVTPLAVVGRLKRATEAVVEGLERYFVSHGLSLADFEILAALRRSGAPYRLTQRELGERVMRTPGTITARIDRLVANGLVERKPHPDDRRSAYVALTRRGMTTFNRIVHGHLENERALLKGLTREEQRRLSELLGKLLRGIDTASGD